MICPNCGFVNLPGNEECSHCHQDLTQLDLPIPQNRIEKSLMEESVRVLRPRQPVTVGPTATVREAMQTMLDHNIGALIVVDREGKLLGIFSERDVLRKVAGVYPSCAELPVAQFMTPDPETITADDTLAFAIHKMDIGGYRHLPLVADGRPSGVVSVRDMLRHITRLCKQSRTSDRASPRGPEDRG
jgi:CBS domain-containing protein